MYLLVIVLIKYLLIDCPALTPPDNGAIDSTDVSQNTKVNVNCSHTYTLFGAELLTCQSDATWDYAMPVCKLGK